MENTSFKSMEWTYPVKPTSKFKGAIQEYMSTKYGNVAVAFNENYAVILRTIDGSDYVYTTRDYTARGGVFAQGLDSLIDYGETNIVGEVILTEDGQSVEDVVVNTEVLEQFAFADVKGVAKDIELRLRAVGLFGTYVIKSL